MSFWKILGRLKGFLGLEGSPRAFEKTPGGLLGAPGSSLPSRWRGWAFEKALAGFLKGFFGVLQKRPAFYFVCWGGGFSSKSKSSFRNPTSPNSSKPSGLEAGMSQSSPRSSQNVQSGQKGTKPI